MEGQTWPISRTQGILAANDLGWSQMGVLALESGGGNSGGLAAKQLCVTAQLRGSAFDALNIRTSGAVLHPEM